MSRPFSDYPAGPSSSDSPQWHSQQNLPYGYTSPYNVYSGGARAAALGESGSTSGFPDAFSPSYAYADSPEMFPSAEFEPSSPISPSCSTSSSSSSCSDAPITPYYSTTGPLPPVALLYTGLDAPVGGENHQSVSPVASAYGYEEWDNEDAMEWDDDATQIYPSMPESSIRSSAVHPEYDAAAALWAASEAAIAQFQYLDAFPASAPALDHPTYAAYPSSDFTAVTSSAVSLQHAHEYPSSHSPVSSLSPALLSRSPLKLHQPQPRRSIPVISLSALASASSEGTLQSQSSAYFRRPTSPALSPLELQSPSSHDVCMTSYSRLPSSADASPIAAYSSQCPCPECTGSYS
ncbi:hypothetical protein DFH08DRAFT_370449 [Mycena albidolilacea]|uniref:Uncharacterized protein n=1 Tax=Mycena albidolilacea TaxID=1033008 RepID=A0AAD7AKH7_9AGAR|nr:hypothetical protein DFH08DRAFT_370449 [Mycena albidolilacea]